MHVYLPQEYTTENRTPVLVNFHGSGFILPWHGSDDFFCTDIAARTDFMVLDVQYALAPERPWPQCHEDAEDIVTWILEQPQRFDLVRLSVSGFSAGGNIAIVAAAVTFPPNTIRNLLAFYPPTDLSKDPSRKVAPDTSGKPLPDWMARIFNQAYLGTFADTSSPRVSPSFADPSRYPRNVLIVTAALDNLCSEAEDLADRIKSADRSQVTLYRAEKCNHGWDKKPVAGSPEALKRDKAYSLAASVLQAVA